MNDATLPGFEMPKLKTGSMISDCQRYRYTLYRVWDDSKKNVVIIGLNPSTADAVDDDNTIRRCVNFAKSWGFGGIVMVNLFAFRATKPKDMKAASDPVGPLNDKMLKVNCTCAGMVVCAWGNDGKFKGRDQEFLKLAEQLGIKLHALKINNDGSPTHPLFLPKNLRPIPFNPKGGSEQ